MRTTLEIDDDLLAAVRELAAQEGSTIGHVISKLARQSLAAHITEPVRNGVRLFVPRRGHPEPGQQLVNSLRDEQ